MLVPLFVILLLYKAPGEEKEQYSLKIWDKLVIAVSLLGTIFMVWLAVYLSFTPVGDNQISGVQARYYLPLIYLCASLLSNNKIKVVCKNIGLTKVTYITAEILISVLCYQCMLSTRLI